MPRSRRSRTAAAPAARLGRRLLPIAVLLIHVACGSPTAPTQYPAAGVWTGTLVDRRAGAGTLRMELRHEPATASLVGTWSATLAQGGTLQGNVTATTGFQPMVGAFSCGATPTAGGISVTVDPGRLHGTFAFLEGRCPPLDNGTIDVTKQ